MQWTQLNCYWPISLAMSSGKDLTNASSCLRVPGGLWLQGTFLHQNSELSVIICKFLTMEQAQRDSEKRKGRDRLWVLTSLCFPIMYCRNFSQNYRLITTWLIIWLNQTLSMHTDYQDNNLSSTNGLSPCKLRSRLQRESISRWSGNNFRILRPLKAIFF